MPKHKTTYLVFRENVTGGGGFADYYGITAWDVEAWNAAHAARIVRQSAQNFNLDESEKLGVVPSRYFSEH